MPSVYCVSCGNMVAIAERCAVCGKPLRSKHEVPDEGRVRAGMKKAGRWITVGLASLSALIMFVVAAFAFIALYRMLGLKFDGPLFLVAWLGVTLFATIVQFVITFNWVERKIYWENKRGKKKAAKGKRPTDE